MYKISEETLSQVPIPSTPSTSPMLDLLLAQAAALGAQCQLDPDTFMRLAWSAFVDAHPGLREYLEEQNLRSRCEELRKAGRIPEA